MLSITILNNIPSVASVVKLWHHVGAFLEARNYRRVFCFKFIIVNFSYLVIRAKYSMAKSTI